jgi:hypothetical protein
MRISSLALAFRPHGIPPHVFSSFITRYFHLTARPLGCTTSTRDCSMAAITLALSSRDVTGKASILTGQLVAANWLILASGTDEVLWGAKVSLMSPKRKMMPSSMSSLVSLLFKGPSLVLCEMILTFSGWSF